MVQKTVSNQHLNFAKKVSSTLKSWHLDKTFAMLAFLTWQIPLLHKKLKTYHNIKKKRMKQKNYLFNRDSFSSIYFFHFRLPCQSEQMPSKFKGMQLSGQQLALVNQRLLVQVWLLAMGRGDVSAVTTQLMSKCL